MAPPPVCSAHADSSALDGVSFMSFGSDAQRMSSNSGDVNQVHVCKLAKLHGPGEKKGEGEGLPMHACGSTGLTRLLHTGGDASTLYLPSLPTE